MDITGGIVALLVLSPIIIGYTLMFREYIKQHSRKQTELDKDTQIAWLKEQVAMYQEIRELENRRFLRPLISHQVMHDEPDKSVVRRLISLLDRANTLEKTGQWFPVELIPYDH